MHRASIMDSPEAPITHHWLDSTHITFGVVTAGVVVGDWKLEASRFRGREPDESRFDIETGLLLPPVGTANRVLFGIPSGWLLTLEKRGADAAFRIACDTAATNAFTGGTAVIGADLAVLPAAQLAGRWRHVALAYDPAVDDNCGQWTLYLDGVETGSAANAHTPFLNHESPRFLLGGRAGGADSFDGLLDCWRASGGIRGAEDLLYFNVQRGTLLRVQ
jgi:hypothetical protein